MALPDLIARLEDDARAQVEAIAQQADAEVRAIEAAAAEEIADATARRLARDRDARQAAFQEELSRTRRGAQAALLEARRAMVARVLERARTLAADAVTSPRYRDAVAAHLYEALAFFEGVEVRVRCAAATEAWLREGITGSGVRLELDPSVGPGFIVEAIDGSAVIDQTIGARLAAIEAQLAIDLVAEAGDEQA